MNNQAGCQRSALRRRAAGSTRAWEARGAAHARVVAREVTTSSR
ncbi:hypothetical protein [Luteipulveratus flavus]|uniref:Uncharacterized protein n=1 Tax=Luteipulveratus flavus TaxID=3031728 RepID=A0ABT6C3T6_9MICO|nr:hypothetical protein [Luteipulveratus sp. YIM 133296]MDF8262952.1 hypothetical protein [Luteipulveratus sp. YIM 133296]